MFQFNQFMDFGAKWLPTQWNETSKEENTFIDFSFIGDMIQPYIDILDFLLREHFWDIWG